MAELNKVQQFTVMISGSILPDLKVSTSELSLMRGSPTVVSTPMVTGLACYILAHVIILSRTERIT